MNDSANRLDEQTVYGRLMALGVRHKLLLWSFLSLMALLSFLNFSSSTAKASLTLDNNYPVVFTPHPQPNQVQPDDNAHWNSYFIVSNNGKAFSVRYSNVGKYWDNNTKSTRQVDMIVRMNSWDSSNSVGFPNKHDSYAYFWSRIPKAGRAKPLKQNLTVKFVWSGTNDYVDWGKKANISINFTNLEPYKLNWRGHSWWSANEKIYLHTQPVAWKQPYNSNGQRQSVINAGSLWGTIETGDNQNFGDDAIDQAELINMPKLGIRFAGHFNNYYNPSGANIVFNNPRDINFDFSAGGNYYGGYNLVIEDQGQLSADVTNVNPDLDAVQPAPWKDIWYKNKGNWNITPDKAMDSFTYRIHQDFVTSVRDGTGTEIRDTMPDGFVIEKATINDNRFRLSVNGNKVSAVATSDVFDHNSTAVIEVQGHFSEDSVRQTSHYNNRAETQVKDGSIYDNSSSQWAGSTPDQVGSSNTVGVDIPYTNLLVNYLDFDHNDSKLKDSTTMKEPVGLSTHYTPTGAINANGKNYNLVNGTHDGRQATPFDLINLFNQSNTVNLYYRTKWHYHMIHQLQGTNPSIDDYTFDKGVFSNTQGDQYYKTDDGNNYNTLTMNPTNHYTEGNKRYYPTQGTQQARVQENDNQALRINYSHQDIPQPVPQKTIQYDGKESTNTTLKDAHDSFTYKISQTVVNDKYTDGTGFKIEDNLPSGFVVQSITASNWEGFNWTGESETNKNHKFEATSNSDIYNKDTHTVTFYIKGYLTEDSVMKTDVFYNSARTTPVNNQGGGQSNTVIVNVPHRDITFNYLDFDHHDRQLQSSTVFKHIPVGYGVHFTPTNSIKWTNGHTYDNVAGATDGTQTSNNDYYSKDIVEGNNNINLYYRTRWEYYTLHEKQGTNPAPNSSIATANGDNPTTDLFAQSSGYAYYKTNDGSKVNTISDKSRDKFTYGKRRWLAVTPGSKTQNVAENDNQALRFDYETKQVPQATPKKTISYNGKDDLTSNTIVNLDNDSSTNNLAKKSYTYTYVIKENITADPYYDGSQSTFEDNLPDGFVVENIDASGNSGMTNTSVSDLKSNGNKFQANASSDVFTTTHTVTYKLTGYLTKDAAMKYDKVNNNFTFKPSSGLGGGQSNTVTTTIPHRDITFNYLDFDHHDRKLQNSTVFKHIAVGYGVVFSPTEYIKYSQNNKGYTLVKSPTDGTYTNTHNYLSDDYNFSNNNINLYYRTKWAYYTIHQVKGTNPSFNDTINANGALLAVDKGEMFYKTNDGSKVDNFDSKAKTNLRDSNGVVWVPEQGGSTQDKQESDSQVVRINYHRLSVTPTIKYIMLDTNTASNKNFKGNLSYGVRVDGIMQKDAYTPVAGDSAAVISNKNALKDWFTNLLRSMTISTEMDNKTTGTNNVYNNFENFMTGDLQSYGTSYTYEPNIAITLNDNKLAKNTNNIINAKVHVNNGELGGAKDSTASTNVTTASEKLFTNTDFNIDPTTHVGTLNYKAPIRTLYSGKTGKVTPFYENYTLKFNDDVTDKTGYGHDSGLSVQDNLDTDQLGSMNFQNQEVTMKNKYMNETNYDDKNKDNDDLDVPMEATNVNSLTKTASPLTTSVADVDSDYFNKNIGSKWNKASYKTDVNFAKVYASMKTGHLYTQKDMDSPSYNNSDTMIDAGNKYYVPVWSQIGNYKLRYRNQYKDAKSLLGVNQISYDLTQNYHITAQMYSDDKSTTKKSDQLYVQPVYSDSDYTKLPSNTNGTDKTWFTSVTDSTKVDK